MTLCVTLWQKISKTDRYSVPNLTKDEYKHIAMPIPSNQGLLQRGKAEEGP